MILAALISFSAMACDADSLKALVLKPTKNYTLEIDRHQEVILDGETQLPKITGIKGATEKGKPMLSVMSGMQVLEGGQMKSYPHRVSFKMNEAEKDWKRPVQVSFTHDNKPYTMVIQWSELGKGCFKAVVK